MADETPVSRNRARLRIMELANMISVPMSLHAVVQLNVPDAIWQGGLNSPLSASQILRRLPPSSSSAGDGDALNLQRLLRLLSSYGVFAEHISGEGGDRRTYSLTEIGRMLVSSPSSSGGGYGAYVLQHHLDALMRAWEMVADAVAGASSSGAAASPFEAANGEAAYDYYGRRPEVNALMQRAMAGVSVPFMRAMLDGYDGFAGAERVVDVGGSAGDCLGMILQKHPHLKEGINFDLPEVVARAPEIPGVRHVGGDMFKSVPSGDAIFMKWILTTWTDDDCKLIMKNCFDALPVEGKLIACEPVLPDRSDDSHRTRALLEGDIFVMTIYKAKAKHRTEDEFRQLGLSVGFHNFRAFYVDHFYTVLEFQK